MALSDIQREELNKGSIPVLQKTQIGDAVYKAPVYISAEVAADASSTAVSFTIPFACEIVDVIVQARATSGSGTATVRKVTTAITDAIVMAVDTTIVRAGTINDAQSTLAAGDNVNVITNGGTDRGLITLVCVRN
jgi:hypothetical protein